MKINPLVSILINNYNYGKYISSAIDSVLEQTYSNIELIVVDDGSIDNSTDIINLYPEEKFVKIFKKNAGQASAFNAGFKACSGDIICFLDSDDYFFLEKISRISSYFSENPSLGWIFHSLEYVDVDGKLLIHADSPQNLGENQFVDFREVFKKGKRFTYTLPCGLCFRRDVLSHILPMPESSGVTISDNYLKYAALSLSPGLLMAEKLAVQRIHKSNTYTFRVDSQILRAEINIKTGFYLREKFPDVSQMANKIFFRGCGEMIAEGNIMKLINLPESKKMFVSSFSLKFLTQAIARILWHAIKFGISKR